MALLAADDLDGAVRSVLRVKFELGLFDHPSSTRHSTPASTQPRTPRRLPRIRAPIHDAAQERQPLLPLSKTLKRIAVIGPNGNIARYGDYEEKRTANTSASLTAFAPCCRSNHRLRRRQRHPRSSRKGPQRRSHHPRPRRVSGHLRRKLRSLSPRPARQSGSASRSGRGSRQTRRARPRKRPPPHRRLGGQSTFRQFLKPGIPANSAVRPSQKPSSATTTPAASSPSPSRAASARSPSSTTPTHRRPINTSTAAASRSSLSASASATPPSPSTISPPRRPRPAAQAT